MLQNKTFVKVLSVVLAVFLWIYVVSVENPTTKLKIPNVPVQLLNMETLTDRGLALTEDGEYYVDVVIEGKRADVLKIAANDISATANVLGYNLGTNNVPVSVTVPDSVSVSDVRTSMIPITIESLVSIYKPITVLFSGTIESGTEPTAFDLSPDEVEVKGAKSKVASVSEVTTTIDVTQLKTDKNILTTDLHAVDKNGNLVSGVKLSASKAYLTAAVFETKEVPLNLEVTGQVSNKFEVTSLNIPKKVKIKGLKDTVSKIQSVTAASIDISSISSTADIPVKVNLPSGIMLSDDSKHPVVSINIKGISVKEFDIDSSKIGFEGLAEGLSVVVNTQSVKVSASGKESVITNLTEDEIHLSIDLTDLETGIRTVPVKLSCDQTLSESSVTPSEIYITINEGV
ncbi:CdaR family protein [Clostridium aminobutyricum]|uniref:YbbR-like protein n=1 Tax=Clostridium aminobutyricum TaxID=33953 RepID=A0A939DA07_CLOAM|nr:CdaR family protein [Clostridium aminobutyricum]MBN7773855.1 hypothetical protein [Clostridium aminobutyricum]